jgi:hypothetical protein
LEIDVLAGSAKRGSTDEEDLKIENELKVSSKNIREHEIVIEHIQNSLNDLTDNFIISNLSIKKLANISTFGQKSFQLNGDFYFQSDKLHLLRQIGLPNGDQLIKD